MTSGGEGDVTNGTVRVEESLSALRLLKPEKVYTCAEEGLSSSMYSFFVKDLEKIGKDHLINTVLVPTRNDTHQDHRLAHDIAVTAFRGIKADLLFYNPFTRSPAFSPRLFVDITEYIDQKIEALMLHQSQKDKYYMDKEFIYAFNGSYRALSGIRFWEAYGGGRLLR